MLENKNYGIKTFAIAVSIAFILTFTGLISVLMRDENHNTLLAVNQQNKSNAEIAMALFYSDSKGQTCQKIGTQSQRV